MGQFISEPSRPIVEFPFQRLPCDLQKHIIHQTLSIGWASCMANLSITNKEIQNLTKSVAELLTNEIKKERTTGEHFVKDINFWRRFTRVLDHDKLNNYLFHFVIYDLAIPRPMGVIKEVPLSAPMIRRNIEMKRSLSIDMTDDSFCLILSATHPSVHNIISISITDSHVTVSFKEDGRVKTYIGYDVNELCSSRVLISYTKRIVDV